MEIRFIVEEEKRLDSLIGSYTELSRSLGQKLIESGNVYVNDEVIKLTKYKPSIDDEVLIIYEEVKEFDLKPVKMDLDIVYEDEDIIVVNKPKGLVVHPGAGNVDNTLVNGLLYHSKHLSSCNGEYRPGIIHRIDKDTSGLLVCAKNDLAHAFIAEQLKDKTCFRKYYAIAYGVFEHDKGTIDAPIARDKKDRQRMTVSDINGKEAITKFEVLKRFDDSTLLSLELKTGRTHQIRVHLKYINHPVLNDSKYSNRKMIDNSGQYLHAYYLSFIHPRTKERMSFETDYPEYMKNYIESKVNYEE